MKQFFTILLALTTAALNAQTLQIARVSSNGTTTVIYTNIKTALTAAQDDDFIYLPAGTFNVDSVIIQKRVNIVGTGIYPDSTLATGKTVINGNVYLKTGRDGGSFQGIEFNNSNGLGNITIYGAGNFTISKSMFQIIRDNDGSVTGTITIKECVVNGYIYNYWSQNGNLVYNVGNSIIGDLSSCNYSIFTNCIFTNFTNSANTGASFTTPGANKEFRNCIFRAAGILYASNDRFFNCHFENAASNVFSGTPPTQFNTTYDATTQTTFVGGNLPATFSYTFDYHLKASTAAIGSGTDGTDKGIYGSMYPYNPNPYNPHIYQKSIAPATNAQGQLQINIKVKAQ